MLRRLCAMRRKQLEVGHWRYWLTGSAMTKRGSRRPGASESNRCSRTFGQRNANSVTYLSPITLIDLAVGTGNFEFPAALELLQPYIVPFDQGRGSLRSIVASEAPEKFSRQTLSLLWLVCGPRSRGSFYEISKIIDRLIASDPDLEVDRRLQWLEHRAERYD